MLENVGTGALTGALGVLVTATVTMGGLFVRSILAQQSAAAKAADATAERYEKEIARLTAEREAERKRLVEEIEFWRSRALKAEA